MANPPIQPNNIQAFLSFINARISAKEGERSSSSDGYVGVLLKTELAELRVIRREYISRFAKHLSE